MVYFRIQDAIGIQNIFISPNPNATIYGHISFTPIHLLKSIKLYIKKPTWLNVTIKHTHRRNECKIILAHKKTWRTSGLHSICTKIKTLDALSPGIYLKKKISCSDTRRSHLNTFHLPFLASSKYILFSVLVFCFCFLVNSSTSVGVNKIRQSLPWGSYGRWKLYKNQMKILMAGSDKCNKEERYR